MELEERDFYKGTDLAADDFPLSSLPRPEDLLSLPTLPESYRIRDVEVVLSGEPMDTISLFCKRREQGGADRRALLSEYSVRLQYWSDA